MFLIQIKMLPIDGQFFSVYLLYVALPACLQENWVQIGQKVNEKRQRKSDFNQNKLQTFYDNFK